MTFLAIIVCIIILVIIFSRNSDKNAVNKNSAGGLNSYQEGYADGYHRAALDVAEHVKSTDGHIDKDFLTAIQAKYSQHTLDAADAGVSKQPNAAQVASVASTSAQVLDPAREAEIRDNKNINTILYVASFLLVGAAVLFIGTALPQTVKFFGLVAVVVLFYVSGIVLHRKNKRLQPAATAFVGTGLALVPFVGLAFYNFITQDGPLAWWITSTIGVVMYFGALIALRSQLLAYASLAFIYSLAISSASVLTVPFVWYFVIVIVVGSAMSLISLEKPSWLPENLRAPMHQSGEVGVAAAVVGSLFAPDSLEVWQYAVITAVATMHYTLISLDDSIDSRLRGYANTAARAFGILTALLGAYALSHSEVIVACTLAVSALVVHGYSIFHTSRSREVNWLLGAQAMLLVASLWLIPEWTIVVGALLSLGIVSVWQNAVVKNALHAAGLIVSAVFVPVCVFGEILSVSHEAEWIAATALALGAGFMAIRVLTKNLHWTIMGSVGYGVLFTQAVVVSFFTQDALWIGFTAAIVASLAFVSSYVERQPHLTIISNILMAIAAVAFVTKLEVSIHWLLLIAGWIVAMIWYGLRWWHSEQNDSIRSKIMAASTLLSLGFTGLLVSLSSPEATRGADQQVIEASPAVIGALTLLSAGALGIFEGYLRKHLILVQLSVAVVTFALQRLVAQVYSDVDTLIYTHWWAAAIGVVALLQHKYGKTKKEAQVLGYVALATLTLPTAASALDNGGMYQLIFLLEHVVLLVASFALKWRSSLIWAVVAIILALLWMLSGYTFVLLALIGIGLIGLVVFKLLRQGDEQDARDK